MNGCVCVFEDIGSAAVAVAVAHHVGWMGGWGSDNSNNERDYKIRSLSAIFRVIDLQFALQGNM